MRAPVGIRVADTDNMDGARQLTAGLDRVGNPIVTTR